MKRSEVFELGKNVYEINGKTGNIGRSANLRNTGNINLVSFVSKSQHLK